MATTFIVGATGYIGGALSDRLMADGGEVRGLAHTPESEAELARLGRTPVRATLADLDILRREAQAADAVVWTVMSFNPEEYPGMEVALNTLNDALAGSGKPLLAMGGGMMFADTGDKPVPEDGPTDMSNPIAGHAIHMEGVSLAGAERGVRSMAIRSSLVYGRGAGMFVRGPIEAARAAGEARYVGDGSQKMSTIYIDDLVDLIVKALKDGPAGTTFNAAGDPPVSTLDLARATAHAAGIDKVASVPPEKAWEMLGFLGNIMSRNMWLDVSQAHTLLGWSATGPSVIDDLETGSYAAPKT
jgi:nucleoside-diphosphate-sugar epimerase